MERKHKDQDMSSQRTSVTSCTFEVNCKGKLAGFIGKIKDLGFSVSSQLDNGHHNFYRINPSKNVIDAFFDVIKERKEPVESEDYSRVSYEYEALMQNRTNLKAKSGNERIPSQEENGAIEDSIDESRQIVEARLERYQNKNNKENDNIGNAINNDLNQENEYSNSNENKASMEMLNQSPTFKISSINDFGQAKELMCYEQCDDELKPDQTQKGESYGATASLIGFNSKNVEDAYTEVSMREGREEDAEDNSVQEKKVPQTRTQVARDTERLDKKNNDNVERLYKESMEKRNQSPTFKKSSINDFGQAKKERMCYEQCDAISSLIGFNSKNVDDAYTGVCMREGREEDAEDNSVKEKKVPQTGTQVARDTERLNKKNNDNIERLYKEDGDDQSDRSEAARHEEKLYEENIDDPSDRSGDKQRIGSGFAQNTQSYGDDLEEGNNNEEKVITTTTLLFNKGEYHFALQSFKNNDKYVYSNLKTCEFKKSSYYVQIDDKEIAEKLTDFKSQLKRERVPFEKKETLNKIYKQWEKEMYICDKREKDYTTVITLEDTLKEINKKYPAFFSRVDDPLASSVLNRKSNPKYEENTGVCDNYEMERDISVASSRGQNSSRQSGCSSADSNTFKGHQSSLIVKVYVGNITEVPVDVIVNAANRHLRHGGGVAKAISIAAGYQLIRDCSMHIKNNDKVEVTDHFASTGGHLQVKQVYHAVGPRWSNYTETPEKCKRALRLTIIRCLIHAEKEGYKDIAFPSISAAIFKVPKKICVESYMKAVLHFEKIRKTESLEQVHFVDIDRTMVDAIRDYFKFNWHITLSENDAELRNDKKELSKVHIDTEMSHDKSTSRSTTRSAQSGEQTSRVETQSRHGSGMASNRSSASSFTKCGNRSYSSTLEASFSDLQSTSGSGKRGDRLSPCTMKTSFSDSPSDAKHGNGSSSPTVEPSISDRPSTSGDANCGYNCRSSSNPIERSTSDRPSTSRDVNRGHRSPFDTNETPYSDEQQSYCPDIPAHGTSSTNTVNTTPQTGLKSGYNKRSQSGRCNDQQTYAKVVMSPGASDLLCEHCFGNRQCVECPYCNKHICIFCKRKVQPSSFCNQIKGILIGDMPDGVMNVIYSYTYSNYRIAYFFNEISLTIPLWEAYLPSEKDSHILKHLLLAFYRRLTFTKGRSASAGKDNRITRNDIPQKTSLVPNLVHGFPDPDFFQNVDLIFKGKGVSIETMTQVERSQVRRCMDELFKYWRTRMYTPSMR